MRLTRLLEYGFIPNAESTLYTLFRGDLMVCVRVQDSETLELSFIQKGSFVRPFELPFDFPLWEGSVFRNASMENLCALLPIYSPSFSYRAGMRVKDMDNQYFLLRAGERVGSLKLDAISESGSFCVIDKRDITLISLE